MKARLILHFDINKTILMSDKAQDASTDHMVNVLLCECAWGRLEPGPKWVPVGRLATDRYCQQPMTSACGLRAQFIDHLPRVLMSRCALRLRGSQPEMGTCGHSGHL